MSIRSFSAMNRVLNKTRNSLSQKHMQSFILLAMNKDLLKSLDVSKLYDKWCENVQRYGLNV